MRRSAPLWLPVFRSFSHGSGSEKSGLMVGPSAQPGGSAWVPPGGRRSLGAAGRAGRLTVTERNETRRVFCRASQVCGFYNHSRLHRPVSRLLLFCFAREGEPEASFAGNAGDLGCGSGDSAFGGERRVHRKPSRAPAIMERVQFRPSGSLAPLAWPFQHDGRAHAASGGRKT